MPEYDPDDHRAALVADGWTTDDIIHRRHVGADETPNEFYHRLCKERHDLANRATAARLMADEMFLRVKDLDRQIDEVKKEIER